MLRCGSRVLVDIDHIRSTHGLSQALGILLSDGKHRILAWCVAEVDVRSCELVLQALRVLWYTTHILPYIGLLRLCGIVSGLAEFDRVYWLARCLLSGDLTLVPLALSKRIIRLALCSDRRLCDTMNVLDCEVAPLNSLTGILAISCAIEESMRRWCLVHGC